MKRMAAPLLLAMTVLCIAGTASAVTYKYPPGPPFRTCPDTLTIFDVQQSDTVLAPCHPATLDTVWGVRGIITGFDAKASSYGFYIQNNYAGLGKPWTGVDVFTGGTNYNGPVAGTPTGGNLVLGDSVVVYGTTQEFPATNGETEIEGPDALQTTNDIILRKISSGNALPFPHVGTTADFNWIPGISALTAEPWEGCLVRIRGPLHVARTQTGAGVSFGTFLVVANATPSDSVMIDGNTLTTYTAPTVGTVLDSITGILNQRTSSAGTGAVNSYRIQLRNGSDVAAAVPPTVTNAFFIRDDQILVTFDRPVTQASAENLANYSLGSFGSIDSARATPPGGTQVYVSITSGYLECTPGEVLTVNGVVSVSSGLPMTIAANMTMVTGVVPIHCIQDPDPVALGAVTCEDRSRYAGVGTAAGQTLTFRGVCVGTYATLYYLEDQLSPTRNGVSIFGPTQTLARGHQYLIVGQTQEFGNETEIVFSPYAVDEGLVGEPAAVPQTIAVLRDLTCDATQSVLSGEDYECMKMSISYAKVTENRTIGQSFFVTCKLDSNSCGLDTLLISNLNHVLDAYTPPDSGSVIDVTGILHITAGTYRLCPRDANDIVNHGHLVGVGGLGAGRVTFFSLGNPARVTRVAFTLPRTDDVDLSVFDLAGRKLATLAKGRMEAGAYSREWSGRTDDGARLGAGMFFYRLKVGSETYRLRAIRLN